MPDFPGFPRPNVGSSSPAFGPTSKADSKANGKESKQETSRGSFIDRYRLDRLRAQVVGDYTMNTKANHDALNGLSASLGDPKKDFANEYVTLKKLLEREAPARQESKAILEAAVDSIFDAAVPKIGGPHPGKARAVMNAAKLATTPNYFMDQVHHLQEKQLLDSSDLDSIKVLYRDILIRGCQEQEVNLGRLTGYSKARLERVSIGALGEALDAYVNKKGSGGSTSLKMAVEEWRKIAIQEMKDLCDAAPRMRNGDGSSQEISVVTSLKKSLSALTPESSSAGGKQFIAAYERYRQCEIDVRREIALEKSMPLLEFESRQQWDRAYEHADRIASGSSAPQGMPVSKGLECLIPLMVKRELPRDGLIGRSGDLRIVALEELSQQKSTQQLSPEKVASVVERHIQQLISDPSALRKRAATERENRLAKEINGAVQSLIKGALTAAQSSESSADSQETPQQGLARVRMTHPQLSDNAIEDFIEKHLKEPWKASLVDTSQRNAGRGPENTARRSDTSTESQFRTALNPEVRDRLLHDAVKALSENAPALIIAAQESQRGRPGHANTQGPTPTPPAPPHSA